jgi:hypothetical protein
MDGVLLVPTTGIDGFKAFGSSLGVNLSPERTVLFRAEARCLFSEDNLFLKEQMPTTSTMVISTSVVIWF